MDEIKRDLEMYLLNKKCNLEMSMVKFDLMLNKRRLVCKEQEVTEKDECISRLKRKLVFKMLEKSHMEREINFFNVMMDEVKQVRKKFKGIDLDPLHEFDPFEYVDPEKLKKTEADLEKELKESDEIY